MDEGQVTVLSEHQSWAGILERLKEKGYTTAICFPKQVQGRVCTALGLGVMKHFSIRYPQIDNFLTKTWKGTKVRELVEFYQLCKGYRLEDYFADMGFWSALGKCMWDKLIKDMPEKSEQLDKRRDLDLENTRMMDSVADLLMVNIFILQRADVGYLQRPVFRPSSNSVGLVILLVQEYDSLYLLLHKDLSNPQGSSGLPFYLTKDQFPTAPKLIEESVLQTGPAPQPSEAEIASGQVAELTTALLQFVLQSHSASPEEQKSLFQSLVLPAVDRFQSFASFSNQTFPFSSHLSAVPSLSTSTELTGEHYLSDCGKYNTRLEYVTLPCGHLIHEVCLGSYIDYMVNKDGEMVVMKLACQTCKAAISESLIQATRPRLYEKMQFVKSDYLRSESEQANSKFHTPPDPRNVQSVDLSASFRCQRCRFPKARIFLYNSARCLKSCQLCIHCVKDLQLCPTCGRFYELWEKQAINSALLLSFHPG